MTYTPIKEAIRVLVGECRLKPVVRPEEKRIVLKMASTMGKTEAWPSIFRRLNHETQEGLYQQGPAFKQVGGLHRSQENEERPDRRLQMLGLQRLASW